MHDSLIWILALLSIACVLTRPFGLSEWVWASGGAILLMLLHLEPFPKAVEAFTSGFDVYFFLVGMMILSEISREEGVFDWLAKLTTDRAKGSPFLLFLFIYSIGSFVTIFMSNDATAVVLTPAVYACVKKAKVDPKPYLFACAMIANAASFLLPISNPANLVVYGKNIPDLLTWISAYGVASVISIVMTFFILILYFKKSLSNSDAHHEPTERSPLQKSGKIVLASLALVVGVLLICSATHTDLGLPTLCCALVVVLATCLYKKQWPRQLFKRVSWGIVPLVGGLFIIVDTVNRAQVLELAKSLFESANRMPNFAGKEVAAFGVAFVSNLANNLPVGLTVGLAAQASQISESLRRALLVGVDLGPNLSVTGSLATVLWLMALRREGERVGFLEFLKLGAIVMPLTLFFSVLFL